MISIVNLTIVYMIMGALVVYIETFLPEVPVHIQYVDDANEHCMHCDIILYAHAHTHTHVDVMHMDTNQ